MSELDNLGVNNGRLVLHASKITQLVEERNWGDAGGEELQALCSQLQKIYHHVNMNYKNGGWMVLDAILLSMGELVSILSPNHGLAIIPEMKLEDALFTKDEYQVSFGGSTGYSVIEYEKDSNGDNQGRLVKSDVFASSLRKLSAGHIFVIRATGPGNICLADFIPEAVTQAMNILSNMKLEPVHCCISDGLQFLFLVLEWKNEQFTYYESRTLDLCPQDPKFEEQLQGILHILLEWLKPMQTDLYHLEENDL